MMTVLVAVSAVPAAGYEPAGSVEITLSNGSVMHANTVGFTNDAIIIGYKVGEAEIDIARVDYVTCSGDEVGTLQARGVHVQKNAEPAGKTAPDFGRRVTGGETGQDGAGRAVEDGEVPKWKRGAGTGRDPIAFVRERMAGLSDGSGPEIAAYTDSEEEQADREFDETFSEFFPEPAGKR